MALCREIQYLFAKAVCRSPPKFVYRMRDVLGGLRQMADRKWRIALSMVRQETAGGGVAG